MSPQTDFVRDALKDAGVDTGVLDQPVPEVGTLLRQDENPAEWIGPLAEKLKDQGQFCRVTSDRDTRSALEKGYRKVPEGQAFMRGCRGGVTMWRPNNIAEAHRLAAVERVRMARTGSYDDSVVVQQRSRAETVTRVEKGANKQVVTKKGPTRKGD